MKYKTPPIGCYIEHANQNAEETTVRVIELAQDYGFPVSDDDQRVLDHDTDPVEADEWLDELEREAIDYLNEQETRSFLYWGHDGDAGAFGLWPSVESAKEDCEFISSKDQDYPPEDFRGEWLHVNDHGNATLYFREGPRAFEKDVEIWSVV